MNDYAYYHDIMAITGSCNLKNGLTFGESNQSPLGQVTQQKT